jgi:hypothetical protein
LSIYTCLLLFNDSNRRYKWHSSDPIKPKENYVDASSQILAVPAERLVVYNP